MIFFATADGTVVKSVPSPVYQGSVGAHEILLAAPTPFGNAEADVAFCLPNGVWTCRKRMTNLGQAEGVTGEAGEKYCLWKYTLPLTGQYGVWTVQFFFHGANGEVLASSAGSFNVARGVLGDLPESPPPDVYDEILSVISSLRDDLNDRAIFPWRETYTYGIGEIAYYPVGEFGAFVKCKKQTEDGVSPQPEPYVATGVPDGEDWTEYWEEIVNFNTIKKDYFDEVSDLAKQAESSKNESVRQADVARRSAEAAQKSEEIAKDSADFLQELKSGMVRFVGELPSPSEAEQGVLYAVIENGDANLFTIYVLRDAAWVCVGQENFAVSGVNVFRRTLYRSDWNMLKQQIALEGLAADQCVTAFSAPGSEEEYMRRGVLLESSEDGAVTFSCRTVPSSDLEVILEVRCETELPSAAKYYTVKQVDALLESAEQSCKKRMKEIVGNAPEEYDTLKEISEWIANDEAGTVKLVEKVKETEGSVNGLLARESREVYIRIAPEDWHAHLATLYATQIEELGAVDSDCILQCIPAPASALHALRCGIRLSEHGEGSVTFSCTETPEGDFEAYLTIKFEKGG